MCDLDAPTRSVSRRSVLGAAMAGAGAALAGSLAATPAAAAPAAPLSSPLRPVLPVRSAQPPGTLLTLLGTSGGPQAEYVRTGTSSVLTVEGQNYVIDAGRGSVTQYLNAGLTFASLRAMFITHLHADHLADYYNYFLLEGGAANTEQDNLVKPLEVFGPGRAGGLPPKPPNTTTPTIAPGNPTPGLQDLTDRLNQGYAYNYNVFMRDSGTNDIRTKQHIHEIAVPDVGAKPVLHQTAPPMDPFFVYSDELVTVTAILVPHGWIFPAFAFRFDLTDGRAIVFSGDTTKSDNVIKLATGASTLVHEVINYKFIAEHSDPNDPLLQHLRDSHTQPAEVAQVAKAAGVPNLVLNHLVPSNPAIIPDAAWRAQVRAGGYRGNIHVGNDLDQLEIPPAP